LPGVSLRAACATLSFSNVTITITSPVRHTDDTHPDACVPVRKLAYLLLPLGLSGCGHTEPFGARTFDTDQPFTPGPPVQLTLNRGPDRRASWLPDGSGILYSTQGVGTRENDICLANLPPTGGRQRSQHCTLSPTGSDLTEALESAAPSANGRLAFFAASSPIGARVPVRQELALASLDDPATRTVLLGIPYTIPGRRMHGGLSQIRWLSSSRLLYLGEAVNLITPCQTCQMDTLRSGLDAVWISVEPAGAPQPIPGTDNASGVSPGSTEDEVYYTIGGDTRVFRQLLSTGQVSVAHDFGVAGIARDVHVVGNRLAAVVGGRVHFGNDPTVGVTQWDSGGIVHVVNLQDGTDLALTNPTELALYRRPQISPDGTRIVAERYPLIVSDIGVAIDTTVARVGDLYLLDLP
jgi:hypothetical protein